MHCDKSLESYQKIYFHVALFDKRLFYIYSTQCSILKIKCCCNSLWCVKLLKPDLRETTQFGGYRKTLNMYATWKYTKPKRLLELCTGMLHSETDS